MSKSVAKRLKVQKVTGKVMACRAPLALHSAARAAAKRQGESLGALMLRGIEMATTLAKKEVAST